MTYLSQDDILHSAILIGVCALICTLISIMLICQLFRGNNRNRRRIQQQKSVNKLSKLLVFACVLVSTLCEWSDLVRHIICYVQNKNLFYYPLNNIMCFADFLYYLGNVLFYTIAISRLHISFYGSRYAISCIKLSFFYIGISM